MVHTILFELLFFEYKKYYLILWVTWVCMKVFYLHDTFEDGSYNFVWVIIFWKSSFVKIDQIFTYSTLHKFLVQEVFLDFMSDLGLYEGVLFAWHFWR